MSILRFACLLIIFIHSFALSQIELGNEEDYWFEQNDWQVYADSGQSEKFEQILSKKFVPLTFSEANSPSTNYWLKTNYKCLNRADFNKFVFEIYSIHTSHIDFYVLEGDSLISHQSGGYAIPFPGKRRYVTKNIVFDLPFKPGQAFTILIKVQSKRFSTFEYKISSQSYFTNYTLREYWYLGLYYGALLLMSLYALSMFIGSQNRLYLFYFLFALSAILMSFAEDGSGFEFLWPEFPELNDLIDLYLSVPLYLISLTAYTIFLMKWNGTSRTRFIWGIIIGFIFLFVLDLLIIQSIYFDVLRILPFTLLFVLVVREFRSKKEVPLYFVLGIGAVLASQIMYVLRIFQFVPANIFTVYFFNYSMILEAFFFILAAVAQIRFLREEKNNAQEQLIEQLALNEITLKKVNEELEAKVQERTIDLKQKNEQLEESQQELNNLVDNLHKLNSKLDYNNWKLGKEVQQEKKKRLIGEKITWKQYQEIYSSEFEGIKLLEQLKWGEEFSCRKCSNTKFTYHNDSRARKCSKCNTVESPTVDTLFQGIKFPLIKAFYISYVVFSKMNYTIEELASLLDLNKNTVHKFRTKCEERLASISSNSTWEELIVLK